MKTIDQGLLDEVAQRLANEFQPEGIWLFVSHAWGTPDHLVFHRGRRLYG